VLTFRPPAVPPELAQEAYDDWMVRFRALECARVRKAAESDNRVEPAERLRMQRACAATH
jgi:hypothetical protein